LRKESFHNKVFDTKSGKLIEANENDRIYRKNRVIDNSLFLEKGNALGKMEAEIDQCISHLNSEADKIKIIREKKAH
jgi:hypothetical protein